MPKYLSIMVAIILVMALPVNLEAEYPASIPPILRVEGVSRLFRKTPRRMITQILRTEAWVRGMSLIIPIASISLAFGDGVGLAAAPILQKATVIGQWENPSKFRGLTPVFLEAGEMPEDEEQRRAFWGEWSIRPAYEQTATEYLVFLCRNSSELISVMDTVNSWNGLPYKARRWKPAWAMFGDKGCHIVLTAESLSSQGWLKRLGFQMNLSGRVDRLFKAMKRYRRCVATPKLFGPCSILDVEHNWRGLKGFSLYTLRSSLTGRTVTVLVRPMIKGADGFNFASVEGVKAMWGIATRPLRGFAISGCCEQGSLKGHLKVVTHDKKLPADFVISDPKGELTSPGRFTLNILFPLHRYTVARTDIQSILHFGLEKWLPEWALAYLEQLKAALADSQMALKMIGEIEEDEESLFPLHQLGQVMGTTKFPFVLIPHWFRAVANLAIAGFRKLDGDNPSGSVRIPMPKETCLRRYIGVWEDVIDEFGVETPEDSRMLAPGECMMGLGWVGEMATWRQPNGSWQEHNLINVISPVHAIVVYGEGILNYLDKSPFLFIPSVENEEILRRWGGADFDDNVVINRAPDVVEHFRGLSLLEYPASPPPEEIPAAMLPESFELRWHYLRPIVSDAAQCPGIGYFCNRWMVWNYYSRLAQQGSSYGFLLKGVRAEIHVLGNHSETIIDAVTKLGGAGLERYRRVVEQFNREVQWLFPAAYFQQGTEVRSRIGTDHAWRILTSGSIVRLPIDHALDAVSQHLEDFLKWENETYASLPLKWKFEPVLAQLDLVEIPAEVRAIARRLKGRYAKFFMADGNVKNQARAAQEWFGLYLSKLDYRQTNLVMTALFREVYGATPALDRSGKKSFRSESLLWGAAAMTGAVPSWLPWAEIQAFRFGGPMSFTASFGMKARLESGEITPQQHRKWLACGVRRDAVILRPAAAGVDIFLPYPGGEQRIAVTADRNAVRATLNGEVRGTLSPGSEFTLQVDVNLPEQEFLPISPLSTDEERI